MSAAFRHIDVALSGNVLHVRADMANQSTDAWRPEDGWAAGYHLFDDATGTLVVDGDRTPLDLDPGTTRTLEMSVATPPEPGEYSVYVSAMRENVAWYYEKGWPFLLVDVSVGEDGTATLRRSRVATIRSVRIRQLRRGMMRGLTLPFESIRRNRGLIRTLVRRDILSRYTGSFGGAFWAVLNPLLLMLTYFFVFGIVLDARADNDPSVTATAPSKAEIIMRRARNG